MTAARGLVTVWGAESDTDDGVTRIVLHTADGSFSFRPEDVTAARSILAAVEDLREFVAEHDREQRRYRAATPEERLTVIGMSMVEAALDSTRDDFSRNVSLDGLKAAREGR